MAGRQPLPKKSRRCRPHTVIAVILRILLPVLLGTLPLTSPGAFPDRFDVHYELHAGGLQVGTTRISLAPLENGRLDYTTFSRATGAAALLGRYEILERSILERAGSRLRPLHYTYRRSGRKPRRVEVFFDWAEGRAANHVGGGTWEMRIPEATLDKQSQLLVLMQDLASGKQPASYRVADGGRLKIYLFRYLGRQRISTALGDFDTLAVERTRADSTRKTTFWCAPALDYLPVRVEHREGDSHKIILRIRSATAFVTSGRE